MDVVRNHSVVCAHVIKNNLVGLAADSSLGSTSFQLVNHSFEFVIFQNVATLIILDKPMYALCFVVACF